MPMLRPPPSFLRIGAYVLVTCAGLILTLLFIHQAVLPVIAWFLPHFEPMFYDLAVYGIYPTQDYVSFDLESPQVSVRRWEDKCDDGGLVFLGPYGKSVPASVATILDSRGELIWSSDEYGDVTNFRMQTYKGQHYLTFWAGHKEGAKGRGAMYMLDSKYNVAHKLQAVGEDLMGDLHEFQLTDAGTALVTVYTDATADLRSLGWLRSENGWVTDCLFQEIDVETGELLFEWVASEHVQPSDTHYVQPFAGYSISNPFDYYHINSIDKDSKGNYLISSRHYHAITYIDGSSGETLWILGPDSMDFVDISETAGAATSFSWQHHARWVSEEEGIISLFDNGAAGPLHLDAPYSQGLLIQLDQGNRTVQLLQSYVSQGHARSNSQGNMQVLPNDQVFIGWGSSGMWSQHHIDGTLMCEVHFSAALFYFWERAKSYRVFKAWGWVGMPEYPPSTKIVGGNLYASWNGATEVEFWELQGEKEGSEEESFESIKVAEKWGFEEAFLLPESGYGRFRIAALDGNRNVLGCSDPIDMDDDYEKSIFGIALGVTAGIALVAGLVYLFRTLVFRRKAGGVVLSWELRPSLFSREKYQYSRLQVRACPEEDP